MGILIIVRDGICGITDEEEDDDGGGGEGRGSDDHESFHDEDEKDEEESLKEEVGCRDGGWEKVENTNRDDLALSLTRETSLGSMDRALRSSVRNVDCIILVGSVFSSVLLLLLLLTSAVVAVAVIRVVSDLLVVDSGPNIYLLVLVLFPANNAGHTNNLAVTIAPILLLGGLGWVDWSKCRFWLSLGWAWLRIRDLVEVKLLFVLGGFVIAAL